jgi:diguanylate cyclase (GGDEF)-like protein
MSFHFTAMPIQIQLLIIFVATVGFFVGRRSKRSADGVAGRSRRELRRAQLVAAELEKIAWELRKELVKHHTSVSKFREKVGKLDANAQDAAWKDLCREAEEILRPTLRLASQISHAHDEIRQQSAHLMTFTEVRTDPLTGVNNRRGLDDALGSQLALLNRYGTRFALAMFDIDHFKQMNDVQGHLYGDQMLSQLARLIDETVRETDVVARYGGEEFLVVMPETDLVGAASFADRLRAKIAASMPLTVSGGVSEALDGDTAESMIARADAALYAAKSAGRNCIFSHTGNGAEAVTADVPVLV